MKSPSLRGLTVLIVDDEPAVREVLSAHLARLGASIREATNGEEALAKVKESPVDLVLSDVRMPGGDGMTFLKRFREIYGKTPFLIMSGYADLALAGRYGATDVLCKPFSPWDLERSITKALPRKAA